MFFTTLYTIVIAIEAVKTLNEGTEDVGLICVLPENSVPVDVFSGPNPLYPLENSRNILSFKNLGP